MKNFINLLNTAKNPKPILSNQWIRVFKNQTLYRLAPAMLLGNKKCENKVHYCNSLVVCIAATDRLMGSAPFNYLTVVVGFIVALFNFLSKARDKSCVLS